jgi:hypothetical protein
MTLERLGQHSGTLSVYVTCRYRLKVTCATSDQCRLTSRVPACEPALPAVSFMNVTRGMSPSATPQLPLATKEDQAWHNTGGHATQCTCGKQGPQNGIACSRFIVFDIRADPSVLHSEAGQILRCALYNRGCMSVRFLWHVGHVSQRDIWDAAGLL